MNWIKVSNRLPEDGQVVLVICRQSHVPNYIDVARYIDNEFISMDDVDYVVFNVKAWIAFSDISIPEEFR